MSYYFEIRVDTFADNLTPHTFLVLTGPDGVEHSWGFAPLNEGQMNGPGNVSDNTDHAYNISSGPMEITEEQFNQLNAYIQNTKENPPPYALFFGSQCTTWAVAGLAYAGIIPSTLAPDIEPNNIIIDFIESLIWNPYWQRIGFEISGLVNSTWISAQRWRGGADPLAFDLDGDGIETLSLDGASSVMFDLNGDGAKVATGWISPDDAFLAYDRNGNGVIDDGTELFGDATPLSDGATATSGFNALADFDSNADGMVDANDAEFANLRVWQDANSDGISQADELLTLNDAGIAAMGIAPITTTPILDNGNTITTQGGYVKTDGTTGDTGTVAMMQGLGDLTLASNPFYSEFIEPVTLTDEAQSLPTMQGAGLVREMREAASLSPEFAAVLTDYANANTREEQIAMLDGLLLSWSETSGVPIMIDLKLAA